LTLVLTAGRTVTAWPRLSSYWYWWSSWRPPEECGGRLALWRFPAVNYYFAAIHFTSRRPGHPGSGDVLVTAEWSVSWSTVGPAYRRGHPGRTDAQTLARWPADGRSRGQPLPALLEELQMAFRLDAAAVLRREPEGGDAARGRGERGAPERTPAVVDVVSAGPQPPKTGRRQPGAAADRAGDPGLRGRA